MIRSMTGYGSAKGNIEGLDILVELKSVNNRFLDCSVRMPRSFLFAEEMVKNCVQKHISRGKVDVFVTIDSSAAGDMQVRVNENLLKGYIDAVKQISENYGLTNDLSALSAARFPDVLTVEKRDLDMDAVSEGMSRIVEEALLDFDKMRQREGEKLRDDVMSRLAVIESYVTLVEEKSPETVAAYRKRLEQRMAEVLSTAGIDENRILTEAAIFADHIAVDEETVRLRSHISQMRGIFAEGAAIGRKLDFLMQEFNREANTITSKCQNSEISHVVIEMKHEIEKIREQIQNLE